MKKVMLFCFILLTVIIPKSNVFSQCLASDTVKTHDTIKGSCIVNGNLVIVNNGSLDIDYTGTVKDTFIVRGNIILSGNGTLWVHADSGTAGELFVVSNMSNSQYSITQSNTSKIIFQNIEFRTQEGNPTAGSIYMTCYSSDSSQMIVTNTYLNNTEAWLLHNLHDQASLVATNTIQLPTEIYIYDSTSVQILNKSQVGMWLDFDSTYTVNLPLQAGNYTWQVGKGYGGLNTHWYLNVNNSVSGIGINVEPTAKLLVNGHGTPTTGEAKTALFFANNKDTLNGLKVGLQNGTIDKRITFNNVELGPIAWQIYPLIHDTLYIKNSTINEIGIAGPSQVTVDSSVLQLAVLASIGGGSTFIINNSQTWNQQILAANSSNITMNYCSITGSLIEAADPGSTITLNHPCFYPNPSGCTENTMVNITTGLPNCNPFHPAGPPTTTGSGKIITNGNCVSSVQSISNNSSIKIYPNPFTTQTTLQLNNNIEDGSLMVYNCLGQCVKVMHHISGQTIIFNRDKLPAGLYFIRLNDGINIFTAKLLITP